MKDTRKLTTKGITISGVFLALCLALLYAASVVPGVELTIFLASSLLVAAVIIEIGPSFGVLFYLLSSILAFLVVPNKVALFPYLIFFGIYGVIKFQIEKINKLIPELVLKLLYFNLIFGISILLFRDLFFGNIQLPELSTVILWVMANPFFLFFDYVYTVAIGFYLRRIHSQSR